MIAERNGNTRWDFHADGQPAKGGYFPRDLTTLDQSINQAFSANSELVVLAREADGPHNWTWIGLYKFSPEGRGSKGNLGAGIWVYDGAVSGAAALRFLNGIVEAWTPRALNPTVLNVDWRDIDPDQAWLRDFSASAKGRSLDRMSISHPETSGLVDVSGDPEQGALLDTSQIFPVNRKYKRIYFSADHQVSAAISRRAAPISFEPRESPRLAAVAALPAPAQPRMRANQQNDIERVLRDEGQNADDIAVLKLKIASLETRARARGVVVNVLVAASLLMSAVPIAWWALSDARPPAMDETQRTPRSTPTARPALGAQPAAPDRPQSAGSSPAANTGGTDKVKSAIQSLQEVLQYIDKTQTSDKNCLIGLRCTTL